MSDPKNNPKNIVITGVSRGLGRAMADEFLRLGHRVAGCGRSPAAIAELQSQYAAENVFAAVDVADDSQVEPWAASVLDQFGPPDLLLNNAAQINANADLWEVSPQEFRRLIDVNIYGVFCVIRHFVPAMIQRGSGVIVNFSSGWGRSTSPQVAPYCATKWAIEGLTRAMAEELPAGLAAIPLNPGVINTEMLQSCFGSGAAAYPTAETWARRAVPFLLQLGPSDNGQPMTAP